MTEISNFETFLFINKEKITISVNTIPKFQNIYEKEFNLEKNRNLQSFDELEQFLNENIFVIEKLLNNFIKKIVVILDIDDFFIIDLSIKKNNYENSINLKNLNYLINEAKENCKKTIGNRKIIHLLIKNYLINNENYSSFPKTLEINTLSLDLKFICLSSNLSMTLERILKKYQISLSQVFCADYVKSFLVENEKNIFKMTKKLMDGYNPNEVVLISKKPQHMGFFEKFFNFFN